jgi:uncharacterized damage-inducible protein DinB
VPHPFVEYWPRVRSRTIRLFEVVPAGLEDWSPGAGAMTIADVFRHLALTERWLFVEVATGGASRYSSHARDLAPSRAAIEALLGGCHESSMHILDAFDRAAWDRQVLTPAGAAMPAWKWLRAMVEHEAHHRGQLYLALRLAGVRTPPLYGLSAEEIMARSPRP